MTGILREAINKAVTDQDIQYDDKLVLEWMDDKVYKLHAMQDICKASPAVLELGKFDPEKGRHEQIIETCAWDKQVPLELHMFAGLEILAKAAGVKMLTRACGTKGAVIHYFMYKDVEFYEITDAGEALR